MCAAGSDSARSETRENRAEAMLAGGRPSVSTRINGRRRQPRETRPPRQPETEVQTGCTALRGGGRDALSGIRRKKQGPTREKNRRSDALDTRPLHGRAYDCEEWRDPA
ncbi:hypothetical protein BESB_008170 [Besnoitia besnoiti]|uniref:Uncharacterized protein n=1 Tax=Besnoitia besnoiti TaxID=94643 RepID=A0A2A9MKG1_BESBE|nr:hypothetical protein BESB_008170 [Besnoitia besnoiti]PFH38475.1 hypothetical protein BESB_008170 [Besnoitia besnoiti]